MPTEIVSTLEDAATSKTNGPVEDRAAGSFRRWFVKCCMGLALVSPTAWVLARWSSIADLVCHFQEPALGVTLLALAVAAVQKRRIALGLIALAAWQVVPLVRYGGANPVSPEPESPERLRILMANVLCDNRMYDDFIHLIRTERPDVIGLVEFTPFWRSALSAVREEYPYRVEAPAGASGLALWFKNPPLVVDRPERMAPEYYPFLHVTFEFAGRPRHLWLAHPKSPLSPRPSRMGNPELAALAERAGSVRGSRIVIGDLNTTEGSPHFSDFLRVSGLRDGRLGFGRQPSWPTGFPYRIPIDHSLVTEDLAVVGRRLGHKIGSDHFPLIVDLAPATNPATHSSHAAISPRDSGSGCALPTLANLARSAARSNETSRSSD